MGREIRANYDQMYLMPPCVEDWVPADHPVRFIRDFVQALDLQDLGFKVPDALDGRPPYAADLLLGVWIYGYMNKLRTTRKLEVACREHMSLIWLTGGHYPDHNTLWRFWAVNKKALRGVFRQAIFVACKADLVGLVLHAVDGTKIAADVSKRKLWRRRELSRLLMELETAIDEVMEQTEQAEKSEGGDYRLPEEILDSVKRREKIREALAELDKVSRGYLHPHDRQARMMKSGDEFGMAYNAQVVVDQQSGLIVAQAVLNEEADNGQLVCMVEQVQSNLGVVAGETVADAGYYAPGQLAEAEAKGIPVMVCMPKEPDRRWNKGEYQKSSFRYDEKGDVYICPLGKELTYEKTETKSHGNYLVHIYRCRCARDCPERRLCSLDKRGRKIERGEHEWAVEHQRLKQEDTVKRELLKKRKAIVEPVFGLIKQQDGFRRWGLRGLENVKTQWALICAAVNLRKLYRHWVAGTLVIA